MNAPDDIITLREADLIGRRQTRETYLHPHDAGLVLKVQTTFMPRRKHWYDRPVTIQPSLVRELNGYVDVLTRLGRHAPFISRVHGLAQTDKGPAVLAENVTAGTASHIIIRDLLLHRAPHTFSEGDVAWAREEYAAIMETMLSHGILNQCQRPENVMLCRMPNNTLRLRLFDFKTLAYRTLISPHLIPGARMSMQRRVIDRTLHAFDTWILPAN